MAYEDRYQRGTQPLILGSPNVFDIPGGYNILQGKIIIDATLTISGSTAAGTAVGDGGALNLFRRIRMIANPAAPNQNGSSRYPAGALIDVTTRSLLRYAITQRSGKYMTALQGDATLGGGVNGAYPIYLEIPIYFYNPNLINPFQTALNMNQVDSQGRPIYSKVQLQLDVAQLLTEVYAGNNGALAAAGTIRWADDRLDLGSGGTDTLPLVQEDHYAVIQSASTQYVDGGMPNDGLFESWMVMAEQGAGYALSDAILNRVRMTSPSLNFFEIWQTIRSAMYNDAFIDPSQSATGLFFFDWTKGQLGNSNAAAGLQAQWELNNVSGAGLDRLRIYTRRIKPLGA
jgi:hypothetical protein